MTVDYAFGHSLEKGRLEHNPTNGDAVLSVRHPLNASDFSSFILQAQTPSTGDKPQPTRGHGMTYQRRRPVRHRHGQSEAKVASLLMFLTDDTRWASLGA